MRNPAKADDKSRTLPVPLSEHTVTTQAKTEHILYIDMKETATYYLAAINAITFIVYGIDKLKARKGMWRIPETTLLMLAAIGGSMGAWLGIKTWHHKTLHKKFRYGVPAILIIQTAIAVCWLTKTVLG